MASPTAQQAENAKIEQIVVQFFAKSLHIILESRIPFFSSQNSYGGSESTGSSASSAPPMGQRTKDCWFNLSLGNCPLSMEDLEPVRRTICDPMVIDVLLIEHKAVGGNMPLATELLGKQIHERNSASRSNIPLSWNTEGEKSCMQGTFPGTVVERWVVQYDWRKKLSAGGGSGLKMLSGIKNGRGGDGSRGSSSARGNNETLGTAGGNGDLESGLILQREQGIFGSQGREVGDPSSMGGIGVPSSQLPKHVVEVPALYKRTVIMLRSLYFRTRLMPAYRLFRLANSSSHSRNFSLSYKVSSPPSPPLPEIDEVNMKQYSFTPVETPYGRMCLSVAYRHTTAVTALEVTPSILSRIITDYVSSPTTEPSKFLSTDSHHPPCNETAGRKGVHVVSFPSSVPSSPSGPSFARRHSWSGGGNKMQPMQQPSPSPTFGVSWSPSPSYPFDIYPSSHLPASPYPPLSSKRMPSDQFPSPHGSSSLRRISSSMQPYVYQKRNNSQPINIVGHGSPPFSSSPSPSPPTSSYTQDEGFVKGFSRSGSAPVSIPKPPLSRSPKLLTVDSHQPSRSSLPPPPRNWKPSTLLRTFSANSRLSAAQLSTSGRSPSTGKVTVRLSTSSESPLRMPLPHIDTFQQVLGHRKAGFGPLSAGENLLRGPSCVSLPRESSKASSHDDAIEEEFSCPFALDDDEAEEQHCSPRLRGKAFESSDPSGQGGITQQRSQDAAVGFLVRMLNKASPLRRYNAGTLLDLPPPPRSEAVRGIFPSPVIRSKACDPGAVSLQPTSGASSSYVGKTTADALEELRAYRDMRDLMRSQSGGKIPDRSGRR